MISSLMLAALSLMVSPPAAPAVADPEAPRPNLVVIFTDDLGYGDLSCYGHPTIATPHLDRMAAEGQRWTQFYVGASVCTPSRTALMTGRLPIRSGMCSSQRRVLFPDSAGGLPASEITLAEALKDLGYATGMVGKWHLGHLPEYLPTNHGFDSYFGIPYSNDMDRLASSPEGRVAITEPEIEYFNVPLLQDTEILERPADQRTLTRRYTEQSVRFIRAQAEGNQPFFLYLAHTMPHVPLFRSEEFVDVSRRGLYGDVVEEIDWSVGQILDTIRVLGIAEETLVVFTSDNGPWLTYDQQGGSAGLLRNGKGSTWEGGMREPFLAWWPGTVPAGQVVPDLGATMDLLPTAVLLAGGEPPSDRVLDGVDLRPALLGTGPSPRDSMFYYRGTELYAVRLGPFKAHFITQEPYGRDTNRIEHDPPLLFHLEHDPSERFDISADHPEVLAAIQSLADEHRGSVEPVPNQLEPRIAAD
ncbi:sulfatase family protein [Tautonia rosea]|uniref:sulfatase family protein n=1 Tax=Tautonia rosea TaxID=2728037 RepID=UPI0014740DF4|nr:sulfatase [Tautonia rosea]